MSRPRPRARAARSGPPRLVAFNKPMNVLSQFTDDTHWPGLGRHLDLPGLYPAGRLDRDSEGLLLLTNDGGLQARLTDPKHKMPKTYLVQVEGGPQEDQLEALRTGVTLKDGPTRPAEVTRIEPPELWERDPPVRVRLTVPDAWLSMTIREGRNRQVRRMVAHVGLPCLRLVRWRIGPYALDGLEPGTWRDLEPPRR
ncbi:pseudouridine synthase [Palleronia caenipelagi]|uniref:Pseudouridine synthase n=1 Tax=Palleronia caenipelagi TaxID=2489174 RepID=A0A547Q2J4_9RHOB|nr:pseudouridine synthase [Palleronia caenipelagi]TRD20612.1 pseudouridine synthase [Palleronia caenipelagi]